MEQILEVQNTPEAIIWRLKGTKKLCRYFDRNNVWQQKYVNVAEIPDLISRDFGTDFSAEFNISPIFTMDCDPDCWILKVVIFVCDSRPLAWIDVTQNVYFRRQYEAAYKALWTPKGVKFLH